MMGCSLRKLHVPKAPAPDSHHIIPQAWQRFQVPESMKLWDPRTVEVCPNCHRRVHEALVKMMRAGTTDDPLICKLAAFGSARLKREESVAYLGLTRFVAAGGSLGELRAHGLYGAQ
jgi:hypothetical protein